MLCNEWVSSGCNTTTVKLMGVTKTVNDCQAFCDADGTCLSYTWYALLTSVHSIHFVSFLSFCFLFVTHFIYFIRYDSTGGSLAMTCFIRIGFDDSWDPMYQAGAYSAQKTHWTVQYTTLPSSMFSFVYSCIILFYLFFCCSLCSLCYRSPMATSYLFDTVSQIQFKYNHLFVRVSFFSSSPPSPSPFPPLALPFALPPPPSNLN